MSTDARLRDSRRDRWMHMDREEKWRHIRHWLNLENSVEEVATAWGAEAARDYARFVGVYSQL